MTAGFGFCKRPFVGALALGLLAFGVSTQAQEIRWFPITASGNVVCLPGDPVCTALCDPLDPPDTYSTCMEREIVLSAGGVQVTLFIQASEWDNIGGGHPGDTNWYLGGVQGTLESSSLAGGIVDNPGTIAGDDLDPVGFNAGNGFRGAFQALKACGDMDCVINGNTHPSCDWLPLTDCGTNPDSGSCPPTHPACIDRPDYVFNALANTNTVSTAAPDFTWLSSSTDGKENPRAPGEDPEQRFYVGTLLVDVPALAQGSYNVKFVDDVNFTVFNSLPGPVIPGLFLGDGRITIATGKCCYGIGTPGQACDDGLTAAQCGGRPGPRLDIVAGDTCLADGCIECTTASMCNNDHPLIPEADDKCTLDTCDDDGVCQHVAAGYIVGVECCDPSVGHDPDDEENDGVIPIDDGFVCTTDSCEATTGVVTNAPNSDTCTADDAVHDGFAQMADCHTDFGCNDSGENAGLCTGTDINTIACTGDPLVCPAGVFDCEVGNCLCEVCSTLVVEPDHGGGRGVLDPNCYALGTKVDMVVEVTGGSKILTGGQFLIDYDPACLDYQSIGPCAGSVFSKNPIKSVDEAAGKIFYVALIDPVAGPGAPVGKMACASFLKLDGCEECDLCFESNNPKNTILTDDKGNAVMLCEEDVCSKPVRLRGNIEVDGPDGADVNSDCGLPTALVEWDTPTAWDDCDGDRDVVCSGAFAHSVGALTIDQATVDALIDNGGVFPKPSDPESGVKVVEGQYYFQCTAQNTCGVIDQHVWTVKISDKNALDVEVHLGQPIVPYALSRCICFELFADCYKDPEEICDVLDFGPPYNFKGHARDSLKVDKNNYICVNAVDPLHTLRSSADIECAGNAWHAIWKGDPLLGGNWLIGGNLDYVKPDGGANGPDTIDVRDFAKFIVEVAAGRTDYQTGDTNCTTDLANAPHADINGDGLVDNIDFSIIQMNFLKASKDACCPARAAEAPVPLTEISVKDLRRMGLAELTVADLNQDGWLNVEDMAAYQQGVTPAQTVIIRKRGTR